MARIARSNFKPENGKKGPPPLTLLDRRARLMLDDADVDHDVLVDDGK